MYYKFQQALLICLFVTAIQCVERIGKSSAEVAQFIKKFLPSDPFILEAGAFNGNDTKVFARFWPKSTIFAFEPVPEIYEIAKKNTAPFKNIRLYQLALSNKDGHATFFTSELSSKPGVPFGAGSLLSPENELKRHDARIVFPKKITVQQTTIDSWAKSQNVSHIDFMWLDMQGHELAALKHAKTILPTVKLIYIEVEFTEIYTGNPLYKDVKSWLESQGFSMLALDFDEKHAALGKAIKSGEPYFGNALFINKNILK